MTVSGSGTVTSTPAGISCSAATCSARFVSGTAVTLSAAPGTNQVFGGWTGDCAGTGACSLTLTADHAATATFTPTYALSVTVSGSGTVTSRPAGISCTAGTCSARFLSGTAVTLAAAPGTNQVFGGWTGTCAGTSDCSLTLTADSAATATFTPTYALSVTVSGSGSVTSTPAGISCSAGTCTARFVSGTAVALATLPGTNQVFSGWTGDCAGSTCSLTMNADHAVTASFTASSSLSVSVSGTGTVTSTPAGISCTSATSPCTAQFATGTSVSLAAQAGTSQVFSAWGGACSGSGACSLTVSSSQSVSATFVAASTLTVTVSGTGSVYSTPAGISCATGTCAAKFATGTSISLSASPGTNQVLSAWGGSCSGAGLCSVTLTADATVSATFLPTYQLSVSVVGVGNVTTTPSGISCSTGTCTARFASGAAVALAATPGSQQTLSGWGGACSGTSSCGVTMTADTSVTATFSSYNPNLVFVTTAPGNNGNMGGLAGADARCAKDALNAGLTGSFVAYLSTSTTSAVSRLGTRRAWVRPKDGLPVFDKPADVEAGNAYYPPRLDATGFDTTNSTESTYPVATGTDSSTGAADGTNTCADWTSTSGNYRGGAADASGGPWSTWNLHPCSTFGTKIYCFEVDATVALSVTKLTGRGAFVTAGSWAGADVGGRSGADAKCAAEATAAGLTGTYLAALATSTAGMGARFDLTLAQWLRPDGIPIAAYSSQFFNGAHVSAFNVTAAGAHLGNVMAWTGTYGGATQTGSLSITCQDWTSSASSNQGMAGDAFLSSDYWVNPGDNTQACNLLAHLYCMQQ